MDSSQEEFDPIRFLYRVKATWHQNCIKDFVSHISSTSLREIELPLKSFLKKKVLITPVRNIFCKSINCVHELDRTFARYVSKQLSTQPRREFICPSCNSLVKIENFGVDKELEALISCLLLSFNSLNSYIKVYLKVPEYLSNPVLDKQNIYRIFRFEADIAVAKTLNISTDELNISIQDLNSLTKAAPQVSTKNSLEKASTKNTLSTKNTTEKGSTKAGTQRLSRTKVQENTVNIRVNRWQEKLSLSPNRSLSPPRVNKWGVKPMEKSPKVTENLLVDAFDSKSEISVQSSKTLDLDEAISFKSGPSTVGVNEAMDILTELESKAVGMKVTRHLSEQVSIQSYKPSAADKQLVGTTPSKRQSKWEDKKRRELSLLKLLKPVWSYVGSQLKIIQENFFSPYAKRQLLHYFQERTRNLCILDLEMFFLNKVVNQHIQFYKIALNIKFKIPENHCSIIDPFGDIYLIGGSDPSTYNELDYIMKYDEYGHNLDSVAKLIQKRSGHAVCLVDEDIYIIGGYNGDKTLKSCEKFNYSNNTVTEIADLNLESAFACVVNFSNKYLFKFGGRIATGKMNEAIERYDRTNNYWEVVCLDVTKLKGNKSIKSTCLGAGVQLNQSEIFFFGGCYDFFGEKSSQSFTVEIEETDFSKELNTVALQKMNMFALPIADRFDCNNQVIIFEGTLFCLQNQVVPKGSKLTPNDRKRVLFCDGLSWSLLEF